MNFKWFFNTEKRNLTGIALAIILFNLLVLKWMFL